MVRPERQDVMTALRVVACIAIFLLLFPHDLTQPVVVGALATMLCLLAVAELSFRDISPNWLLSVVAAILSLAATGWLAWIILFPPPPMPTGPLIPAGEPTPAGSCPSRPGDLVVALGTDRVMARGDGPFRPFMAHECPGPILTRTREGLMVDALGYDWSNDIVYIIRENRLDFLMVAGLTLHRPDRSTIELLDRFGDPVVYVRYLNRNAVRIRGRWLCEEKPQTVIHDSTILTGGVRIGGAMFGQRPIAGNACAQIAPGPKHGFGIQIGSP